MPRRRFGRSRDGSCARRTGAARLRLAGCPALADERLGQAPRGELFADAVGTVEQICVVHSTGRHRSTKCLDGGLLRPDRREKARHVYPSLVAWGGTTPIGFHRFVPRTNIVMRSKRTSSSPERSCQRSSSSPRSKNAYPPGVARLGSAK